MAKLNVRAFGLASGIIWALGVFIVGIINIFTTWANGFLAVMSSAYLGYTPTLKGSIIGGVWAFADAFIGGIIFAWLYNKLSK